MRQTTCCAEGLTLFLCGTTSGRLFRLSETPLVSLGGITVFPWMLCLTRRFTPRQCLSIRDNPSQDTQHTGVIEPYKCGMRIGVGAHIDDNHLTTLPLLEPADAPPEHCDLASKVCPYRGCGRRVSRVGLPFSSDVTITKVGESPGNVAGFMVLEDLMDTAAAQARRRGDVADGEAGLMGRNDGPDTFALGFCEPRGG
jgi:hypothetical protein